MKSIQMKVLSAVSYIIGFISLYFSYDKFSNYVNTKQSILNVNSYVGGDAYNYIINASYFTGFAVIGIGLLIIGTLFIIGATNVENSEMMLNEMKTQTGNQKEPISDVLNF